MHGRAGRSASLQAETMTTTPQGWRGSISPYLERAPLAALFLGISSGFPFAMIGATLTTRLAQDGIEKSSVTAFALTFLAYNLKWAWAPIVDRVQIPILGRIGARRSWLILVGALVFAAVSVLGNLDPKASLSAVAMAAIAVGLAGATYDIVIDAYRIELLAPHQLGTGSGMSQYGWRIGSAVAGAIALVVAERAGWGAAYMACAALVLPAIITGLVMGEPERKIERHWPQFLSRTYYAAFILSFPFAFFAAARIDAWLGVDILTLMVLVGYLFPLFDLSARRARDIGWSGHVNWILAVPALALVATLAGGGDRITTHVGATMLWIIFAIGGALVATLAILPSRARDAATIDKGAIGPLAEFFTREGAILILLFLLFHKLGDTLANLTFRLLFEELGYSNDEIAFYDVGLGFWALLAGVFVGGILYARLGMKRSVLLSLVLMAVSNFSFALLAATGHSNWGMAGAIGFENFASGIGGVCVVAYLSALADLRFTATHFALFSAAASILGRFLTGTSAGKLIDQFGYVDYYLLTTGLAVPGILIFWWMMRSGLVDRSIGTAGEADGGENASARPAAG